MRNDLTVNAARGKSPATVRCAIYTRKSTEEGLDQDFNSLHAQREAAEAYIKSQKQLGWTLVVNQYNDGGFSGGSLDRPALQKLLEDVEARRLDCVVVYKIDRLSRSLLDFARLMDRFDQHAVIKYLEERGRAARHAGGPGDGGDRAWGSCGRRIHINATEFPPD
jgi:site-specific DNA recombinase